MRNQRVLRMLASALLLAVLPGCAWLSHRKASPVVGTWANRTGAVWMIKGDGTFDVDLTRDGKRDAWGKYTVTGDTMTITGIGGMMPKDCKGDGVYHFKRTGPELAFTLISDSCKVRKANILLGWRLRR